MKGSGGRRGPRKSPAPRRARWARTPSPAVGVPQRRPGAPPAAPARTHCACAHSPAAARGQRFWTPRRCERGAPAQFTPALQVWADSAAGRWVRRPEGWAGPGLGRKAGAASARQDNASGRGRRPRRPGPAVPACPPPRARRQAPAPGGPAAGAGLRLPAAPAAGAGAAAGRRGLCGPPLAGEIEVPAPAAGRPAAERGEVRRRAGRVGGQACIRRAGSRGVRAGGSRGQGVRACVRARASVSRRVSRVWPCVTTRDSAPVCVTLRVGVRPAVCEEV